MQSLLRNLLDSGAGFYVKARRVLGCRDLHCLPSLTVRHGCAGCGVVGRVLEHGAARQR